MGGQSGSNMLGISGHSWGFSQAFGSDPCENETMSLGGPQGRAPLVHPRRSSLILDHRSLPFGRPASSKPGLHLSEL
eukprot:9484138-Pyramimonas_sp.AAC.1